MPRFAPLRKSLTVDVLVVGGGMTGISAAYLLKKAGRKKRRSSNGICWREQDTGHHGAFTCVTDLRLQKLVKTLGKDHVQAVWDAGLAAIDQIGAIIDAERISCEFARVPGYLHASLTGDNDETDNLKGDADLARAMGFAAHYLSERLVSRPGIRFANQAKFHPLKYLAEGLCEFPGAAVMSLSRPKPASSKGAAR